VPQFFLPPEGLSGERFRLSGREAGHAGKSLRLEPGDFVELFDGSGRRFEGAIETVGRDGAIEGRIVGVRAAPSSAAVPRVTLYLALLKSRGWDWAVEKATELGVSSVAAVSCERSVVRLESPDKIESFLARSRRVAMAASKQSGRPELPVLEPPRPFQEALARALKEGPALLAWEGAARWARIAVPEGLQKEINNGEAPGPGFRRDDGSIGVFIGPEGGFSPREIEEARRSKTAFFGLGPNVLRSETAAVAALSALFYELAGDPARPGGGTGSKSFR
jgi:16S rRNA (uracil1498-N3)-methyltransferase